MSSDPGKELVEVVYSTMKIDPEWSLKSERSFIWWSGHLAQTVSAGPVQVYGDIACYLVQSRADLVRGFQDNPRNFTFLEFLAATASLSGFVRRPDQRSTLQLACSAWVHQSNLEWLKSIFALAVAQQAADAYWKSQGLALAAGAEVASTTHPKSGPRLEYDEMLGIMEHVIGPAGEEGPRWSLDDFGELNEYLGRPRHAFVCETGVSVEFPFGKNDSAHLQVTTGERHPQLGNGLLLRLTIPFKVPQELRSSLALDLNGEELESEPTNYSFGSWCAVPGRMLTHATFLPNVSYFPGLLNMMVKVEYHRAVWAAQILLR